MKNVQNIVPLGLVTVLISFVKHTFVFYYTCYSAISPFLGGVSLAGQTGTDIALHTTTNGRASRLAQKSMAVCQTVLRGVLDVWAGSFNNNIRLFR